MKRILIVGLPFFPKKYQYAVNAYRELGCEVKVLLNKRRDDQKPDNVDDDGILSYSSNNNFLRLKQFIVELVRFRPSNIDCYNYSVLSVIYVLIARAFGVNVRFWIIGGELIGDTQNSNSNSLFMSTYFSVKRSLTWICLRCSNAIFAKELHHVESIRSHLPNALSKVVQIHNCVPVPEYSSDLRVGLERDFLYANAVIERRNVISLIDALDKLRGEGLLFKAAIYGFNSISNEVYAPRGVPYSKRALANLKNLEVSDFVEAHGFVENINQIMKEYKFFIFPSDVILANYALLESMSLGLVPIVYPGNGYEELVEDGVNGFVAFDYDLSKTFKRALSMSGEEYMSMSKAAYDTIDKKFSMQVWLKKLSCHLY